MSKMISRASNVRRSMWILAILGLLTACSGQKGGDKPDSPTGKKKVEGGAAQPGGYEVGDEGEESGLEFDLEEGSDGRAAPAKTVEGTPLGDAETKALLERLPGMGSEETGVEFAFRERSKPAPRAGETVETAFPPEEQPPAPEVDEDDAESDPKGVEVVRRAPEGHTRVAARVAATFSKPMVSVTSQEEAAEFTPVRIEPEVDGEWRWIGTKTLIFEPTDGRLPMATEYKVTVPGATKAADGQALGEPVVWTFETPPVQVERWHPTGGPQGREPMFFVEFNQRVDRSKILEYLKVWGGGHTYRLVRVAEKTARENEELEPLIDAARPGQWVAFRATEPLPAATEFQMALEKGAPSAEGPRRTQTGQYAKFRTYDALALKGVDCGWQECRPFQPWVLKFNNAIDAGAFEPSMIRVEPELEGRDVEVDGHRILIRGRNQGRTTYKIRVDGDVQDEFGQALGDAETVSVDVASAEPALHGRDGMVVQDPAADPALRVWSVNWKTLKVEIRRVEPKHWEAYLNNRHRHGGSRQLPGKKVVDRSVDVQGKLDAYAETTIDLKEALDGEYGQLVVSVRPETLMDGADPQKRRRRAEVLSWVQVTDIGLDAYVDRQKMIGWATSLESGAPLEGVKLQTLGGGGSQETGEGGVATLELPENVEKYREGNALVARKGDDVAMLPESHYSSTSTWTRQEAKTLRWYAFDDRQMYRPGETVHVKGWVREANLNEGGALSFLADDATVTWRSYGPRGNELSSGEAELTDLGGFDFTIDLPDDVNLGHANVQVKVTGRDWADDTMHEDFKIQEFRTPQFEVTTDAPAGPHLVGDSVDVTTRATYYAGGALSGSTVDWRVSSQPGHYQPPGWEGFVFGDWQPWWWHPSGGKTTTERMEGTTDAGGRHTATVKLNRMRPPRATVVTAEASVQDVTRQVISAQDDFLVHPARTYVGMRTARNFVEREEPIDVEVVAVNLDGEVQTGRSIKVVAERLEWRWKDGEIQETVEERDTCEVASKREPVTCTFETPVGGSYRLTAVVHDESGRPNRSRMRVWVGGAQRPSARSVEMEDVQLIPDKERYKPGETAEILVQAPFEPADGLLTVRHHEIVETRRFEMKGSSKKLEIPIAEGQIPNLDVHVPSFWAQPSGADRRGEAGPVGAGSTRTGGGTAESAGH